MITFEQARQIVISRLSPGFLPEAGFKVADWGWENDTHYQLSWSVKAEHKAPSSGPYPVVDKTTGEYKGYRGAPYLIPNAVPFGAKHPELSE